MKRPFVGSRWHSILVRMAGILAISAAVEIPVYSQSLENTFPSPVMHSATPCTLVSAAYGVI